MIQADPRKVRVVLDRLFREGSIVSRLDGSAHQVFPVAVSRAEGESLRAWVIQERATQTLEVGLGFAVSTLYMCEGLLTVGDGRGRHVAIDPHQRTSFAVCGLQVLEDAGVAGLVTHHAAESQIVLPRLVDEGRSFDLAFVDGNHRFDGVFLDLVYLGRLVRGGGVIFVDDYQLPAVARAADYGLTNLGWTREEVSPPDDLHRWAVLRTPPSPLERPFDRFVEF